MSPFSWARWLRSLFRGKVKTYRKGHRPLRLEELETRLAPATYTWSGAGGNARWSNAANWGNNTGAPSGVASALEDLAFPAGISQTSTTNDLVLAGGATPTFRSIAVAGSGYSLAGNALALGSPSAPNSGTLRAFSRLHPIKQRGERESKAFRGCY